jgi:hypothetical protein
MRKIKRWRYYCDFCKKSGASGHHMQKHEASCCRNPNRTCRMCAADGSIVQQDMQTLLAALANDGLEELTRVTGECPACILAAIMQDRMNNPITFDERGASREFVEFDFKAACVTFWKRVNEANRDWENVGFVGAAL